MSQPITAIHQSHLPEGAIHPAWLAAGYGIIDRNVRAYTTQPYYNWQTLPTDFVTPRATLPTLVPTTVQPPQQAMPSALVGQPQQQPALPAILPQVQAGATTNGASAELNQLLNSTGTLASDVVAQSALLEQAQKQVEQQKAMQQQQMQVNQLKQQNAILAQQINALQTQQQTLNPASLTVPLVNGGVASSNPYLVGLGSLGSYGTAPTSLIYPANQLYSPGFSTSGMNINPAKQPPASTTPVSGTAASSAVSATPTSSAVTDETPKTEETKPAPSGKRVISNPDGKLVLTDLGIGKHKLDSEAAEAFKKANKEVKEKTGKDIPIISSYRSHEHNKKIGGAPNSNHTRGGSIDIDKNASNFSKASEILEAHGFKSLKGLIYNKPGSGPQHEDNHFDFMGDKA